MQVKDLSVAELSYELGNPAFKSTAELLAAEGPALYAKDFSSSFEELPVHYTCKYPKVYRSMSQEKLMAGSRDPISNSPHLDRVDLDH
ncbi:MAG: hypothetical protein AAGG06_19785, partial [Pseudomonadota bacterium]